MEMRWTKEKKEEDKVMEKEKRKTRWSMIIMGWKLKERGYDERERKIGWKVKEGK